MDAATIGWIGGLAGAVIGLLGGVVGTYFSIKNTQGPRERAFMVKFSAGTWIAVLVFLAALMLLPSPYRFYAWIPYGIALPLGIRYCNRRQQDIRQQEGRTHRSGSQT